MGWNQQKLRSEPMNSWINAIAQLVRGIVDGFLGGLDRGLRWGDDSEFLRYSFQRFFSCRAD
jgi:hypothetical protein